MWRADVKSGSLLDVAAWACSAQWAGHLARVLSSDRDVRLGGLGLVLVHSISDWVLGLG